MKAVLAGKSRYSERFKPALSGAGLELIAAETASELKSLPEDLPVVLLYDTELSPLITDKGAAEKRTLGLKPHDLIVFLMDRDEDASSYIESQVLDTATHLASVKRRVAVLMRSSRASDADFDDRYRKARQKGVAFIKYETVDIIQDDGGYRINAWDGKVSLSMDTPLCIDCAAKPASGLYEFADALRIRTCDGRPISGSEGISGGRWFLSQGTTFKRNVKLINTDTINGDIQKILPSLVKDLLDLEKPGQEKTAFVDSKKCAFCYTCYRVCPHSALGPDENNEAMKVNDLLCETCGICLAVCPASAIEFREVSEARKDEAVERRKAETSGTRKDKAGGGRLKVFCCENSAFIASKAALGDIESSVESFGDFAAAVESVPCGGEVSAGMMTEALKRYDNVLVAVCCDDACKHRDGNKRCARQVERLKEKLDKLGYDPDRLSSVKTGITMVNILRDAAFKACREGEKNDHSISKAD